VISYDCIVAYYLYVLGSTVLSQVLVIVCTWFKSLPRFSSQKCCQNCKTLDLLFWPISTVFVWTARFFSSSPDFLKSLNSYVPYTSSFLDGETPIFCAKRTPSSHHKSLLFSSSLPFSKVLTIPRSHESCWRCFRTISHPPPPGAWVVTSRWGRRLVDGWVVVVWGCGVAGDYQIELRSLYKILR